MEREFMIGKAHSGTTGSSVTPEATDTLIDIVTELDLIIFRNTYSGAGFVSLGIRGQAV